MKNKLSAEIPAHGSQACGCRHMAYEHSMTQGDPALGAAEHGRPDSKMIECKAAAHKSHHTLLQMALLLLIWSLIDKHGASKLNSIF